MNKNDKKIFEEALDILLEMHSDTNYFISDKKDVYSLKECLDSASDKVIDAICFTSEFIEEEKTTFKKREDKINYLKNKIPELFKQFLNTMNKEDKETIKEYIENKCIKNNNITFTSNGFMYGFRNNNEIIYIIPNELMDIYDEIYTKDFAKESDKAKLKEYLYVYLMINGLIEKDLFIKLVKNNYGLDINREDADKFIGESVYEYKNKYYAIVDFENNKEAKKLIDEILETKAKTDYKILSNNDVDSYRFLVFTCINELKKILKRYKLDAYAIFVNIVSNSNTHYDFIFDLDVSDKVKDELETFLMDYEKSLRFWNLNGRTLNEDKEEKLKEKYLLRNIPKKTDLKSCLKSLSKEAYDEICYYVFDEEIGSIDELCQEIIKLFKDDIEEDEDFSNILFECQNGVWDINVINDMMIEFGQAFIYQDNDNVRVFMPDEIFEIVMDNMDDELDTDDLVISYITMNGLIPKKKLQELLKENHDIDISIKELDKIVSKTENLIKKDLYMMIDFEDETKNLLDVKTMLSYRKVDMSLMETENDFFDELEEFFEEKKLSNKIKEDVIGFFASTLKMATYSKDFFDYYLENNGIELTNKDKKELLSIVSRYKNDIPIWVYNGYTINEYNEMQKRTKVGRNDPCICGSGKKYKKCCGKNNLVVNRI